MARLRMRKQSDAPFAIQGPARADKRTKDMIPRLQAGDIAIINHRDLDRVAADGLIEKGVVAVINCAQSISGRYPNGGPIRVVHAGITLVDDMGPEFMDLVQEGDVLRIEAGEIWRNGELLGRGRVLDEAGIELAMEAARAAIGTELERFAANTLEYIQKEARLTFEPLTLPPVHTKFAGRHALVVVRGHDYRSDLAALRPYIREYQPVLIGVDGGADALLEHGLKPDIIIGDFDSVSPEGLACGAELVHHVHPDGRAPVARTCSSGASTTWSSSPRAPAKTSRCCSPTSRRRSSSSRWAPTPPWSSSSTRAVPAWRRRSSPGCASDRCWSTPRV